MRFSRCQRFLDLSPKRERRAPFPFETAQPVPQTNDFALLFGVHRIYPGFIPM
jgi:hypothetical protein